MNTDRKHRLHPLALSIIIAGTALLAGCTPTAPGPDVPVEPAANESEAPPTSGSGLTPLTIEACTILTITDKETFDANASEAGDIADGTALCAMSVGEEQIELWHLEDGDTIGDFVVGLGVDMGGVAKVGLTADGE